MPEGKASKGATLSLEARDVAVGDGKTKVMELLPIPRLAVGALSFEAEAREGDIKISKFGAGGKDVELSRRRSHPTICELAMESGCLTSTSSSRSTTATGRRTT